jgi:voltage-gated potassium channel Kch
MAAFHKQGGFKTTTSPSTAGSAERANRRRGKSLLTRPLPRLKVSFGREAVAKMETSQEAQPGETPQPTVIIVGFGLPGRFVAEILDARKIPYSVIELNPSNARSVASCGKCVFCGDAREPDLLKQAGIETARLMVLTIPDEKIVLDVLRVARTISPTVRMMARCHYTSTGMKAERAGAFLVVVEEQIVALEFARLIGNEI